MSGFVFSLVNPVLPSTRNSLECRLNTVAGAGSWQWGGRMPSVPPQREGRLGFGWGWGWAAWARTQRAGELRPWVPVGAEATATGSGGMRCSLRVCVVLGSLALLFLTSLFFSFSRGAGLPYLEPLGWEESHRVKLVPSYAGSHRAAPAESTQQKTCACARCVGDPGVSDWFDESYDPDISPVWTRDNIQLPSDVYYWWVVSDQFSVFFYCITLHRL